MSEDGQQLQRLTKGIRIVMLTTTEHSGHLTSRPLTVQRIDDDGTLWFLVDRQADWLTSSGLHSVNAAFVSDDVWVSASGVGLVVTDPEVLEDLGNPVADAYFAEDAEPVALRIDVERADYWDAPGKLSQLVHLGKAVLTKEPPDMRDHGTIEP